MGRHRRREGKKQCSLCGDKHENVSHVLWVCSAYSGTRASFMKKLYNINKSPYVLGSELWVSKVDGLVKELL